MTVRLPDAGERLMALTVKDCAALALGDVVVKPVRVEVDGVMAGEVAEVTVKVCVAFAALVLVGANLD